jgi:hypothetical protein
MRNEAFSECEAIWIDSQPEAKCQLEAGHTQEHSGKFKLIYENGMEGAVEISWKSEGDLIQP